MSTLAWLIAAVVLFIFEAITVGLVCIWFCFGALAAFAAAFFTENIVIQLFVFVLVSAISFIIARPVFKRAMPNKTNTNSTSRLIGKTAKVTEEITVQGGRVKVGDVSWIAKSSIKNDIIEVGALVKIIDTTSNVLTVERL